MRYTLLIYCEEETAVRERREEQFTAILDGLRARGVLAGTQRLLSARATRIVRCRDGGDTVVTASSACPPADQSGQRRGPGR